MRCVEGVKLDAVVDDMEGESHTPWDFVVGNALV